MSQDNYTLNDIPGYEGRYAVTNDGRIWSHPKKWVVNNSYRSHKGFWMKTVVHKGYRRVMLSKNGQFKCFTVHRLVARIYLPNPHNLPHINHKNGNKADNRVENLEWSTARDNTLHAIRNDLRHDALGEKSGTSKITLNQAINIRHCRGSISGYDLARLYGIGHSQVIRIWSGASWGRAIKVRQSELEA